MTARRPAVRLEVRGVRKAFGSTVALDGVDLEVAAGEVHAVVGENGAGKSTLMKVLSGACRPDAGEVYLDGTRLAPRSPHEARRLGIATVYQEPALAPHLTVEENVLLGVEPAWRGVIRRRVQRAQVEAALAPLAHADLRPNARVSALSPAARQLVELARALAQADCRLLILDEPTSSLAIDDLERLFALIRGLRDRGLAIIYISHFLEEVRRIADRFTALRDGRTVGSGEVRLTSTSAMIALIAGRDVQAQVPHPQRTIGPPLLVVEDLAGDQQPVRASLTLHRGEIFGIAGLVGAGRTELMRTIFGLQPVRHGRIRVGLVEGPAPPSRRLAQGVGLLSEDRTGEGLALSRSLADNLTLSRLEPLGPGPIVLPQQERQVCQTFIDRLAIRCAGPDQPVWQLSGGNQQKVALARLLHHDVDLLLLDEPTRGIDVGSRMQIHEIIDALARQGKSILMVSSSLSELLGTCDRLAVMCRGRLGPARPVAQLDEHGLLVEAMDTNAPQPSSPC